MNPETLAGLCDYVSRQAVSSARIVSITNSTAVECSAADGSRWYVTTDRYGNAYGWADTLADAYRSLADAHTARAITWSQRATDAAADCNAAELDRCALWVASCKADADNARRLAEAYRLTSAEA